MIKYGRFCIDIRSKVSHALIDCYNEGREWSINDCFRFSS